ncbi:MAG: hypothetical protein K8S16_21345 [Bacteroidales bacterium]|nr:hypothetical protein [Bacteroidales bacterium]
MEARNLIADNYFGMIKNLSADVKLELISRISDSLREPSSQENDSWKNLFGAYNSEQTAEEIIEDLRNSRFTNRQIEDL